MYDRPLAADELDILRPLVKRRAEHEPLQYITGEAFFYNCTLKVNQSVLIPRQETEQLVQLILEQQKDRENLKVLDIGTGSGCIPIALSKEVESWDLFACDVSSEAISTAEKNAKLNNAKVNFFKHDLFNPDLNETKDKFDVIISNPPYILNGEEESLDKEVKNYEPHLALFCNSTENIYAAIERFCDKNLTQSGAVYLELHEEYSQEVKGVFEAKKWTSNIVLDLDEKARFLVASRN
jgi:release factor glutamine methyltransferase